MAGSQHQAHRIALDTVRATLPASASIALVGTPNSGKSTLFNRLTGLRQKTANFPGVTVEKHSGRLQSTARNIDLLDLPGLYTFAADSTDEQTTVDVLLGQMPDTPRPDALVAVVDATRVYQSLHLLQQLIELQRPMIVVLSMSDVATAQGLAVDHPALSQFLGGVSVYAVVANTGRGVEALKGALLNMIGEPDAATPNAQSYWPPLREAACSLAHTDTAAPGTATNEGIALLEHAILNDHPSLTRAACAHHAHLHPQDLQHARARLAGNRPVLATQAQVRYGLAQEALPALLSEASAGAQAQSRLLAALNHPVVATVMFFAVMAVVFQAVFAWATPLMDAIDGSTVALGARIGEALPAGMIRSLIVDGVIAGVGSVVIFLPQILFLFAFIILLEDTGYLARAAYLVDRAMRSLGLSGQSVIPLLSSFACAVPGIMATRVIPNRRDRLATIMAAPFMTCSARLPIYALLIAAFVPASHYGMVNLQGLVLFGLYLLGILGGVVTAFVLKRSALSGPTPSFVLSLPDYRRPDFRNVIVKLFDRAWVFLRRAGSIIFLVAILVWALAYFPRSPELQGAHNVALAQAEREYSGEALAQAQARLEHEAAAAHLSQSALGRAGRFVEPMFSPLGWDWKISAAVLAGFPAREVVIAVLGTIYAVGGEADEATLSQRLHRARRPDGSPVFTLPMVFGLLVFYALCLQCAATLAVMRRETNSWRWPIFSWTYMTGLGYVSALLIYQVGSAL